MANEREEALKKLLVSNDFKEESYGEVPVQDLIILKNSAASMKEKNAESEQAALFFEKREEFFMHVILKRLQKMETMYCIITKATNLPFVHCDEETCNDQVWIFSDERFAKKAAFQEMQNKREVLVAKIENSQFLTFYTSLFSLGINELLLDKGANAVAFDLDKLVRKPDLSALPVEKRPVENPELVLTGVYFAQERALPEDMRNQESLKDLQEELIANVRRGKILLPVQAPEDGGAFDPKNMRLPLMKMKNGDSYQPVFSDAGEFQRFNREKKFHAIAIDSDKLKRMMKEEIKGIMLNPTTLRLVIPKQSL